MRGDGGIQAKQSGIPFAKGGIRRTIPSLWHIRIPTSIRPDSLNIDYTLISCSGKANYLSHSDKPTSEIRVSIEPTTPRIISVEKETIGGKEQQDSKGRALKKSHPKAPKRITRVEKNYVVEGGVILRLYPVKIDYAGWYCGRLTVTIHGN
jgi:hypothetical protein